MHNLPLIYWLACGLGIVALATVFVWLAADEAPPIDEETCLAHEGNCRTCPIAGTRQCPLKGRT